MVRVTNEEVRVHSFTWSNPRGFQLIKPGDNHLEESVWAKIEKQAADLVKAGVLKVQTNVAAPPPVPKVTPADADAKEDDEGESASDPKAKRKRW